MIANEGTKPHVMFPIQPNPMNTDTHTNLGSASVASDSRNQSNETRDVFDADGYPIKQPTVESKPTTKTGKRGRPYKNPNLVPQVLADYIRKLEKENADLRAEIEQLAADKEDSKPTTYPLSWWWKRDDISPPSATSD